MKFAIDIGHNAPVDTGAVGFENEDNLTRSVGQKLIEILVKNGHYVVETCPGRCSTLNQSLKYRVTVANLENVDVFVSIHFNAVNFSAHGTEVYALSKTGGAIAKSILDEIVKLGFYNRGVKLANFYVLRHTTMPAVLVECCFVDSHRDMSIFNADKMAVAIAEGLIGKLPPVENELRTLRVNTNTWLKSTVEQSSNLANDQKSWLRANKYQVLAALPEEEGHHWVRLKDGSQGFVFAGHCQVS